MRFIMIVPNRVQIFPAESIYILFCNINLEKVKTLHSEYHFYDKFVDFFPCVK